MITIKEEFLGHVKTQRAIRLGGYAVLALWIALKGYAAAGNTAGFIPEEAVDDLPGVPSDWRDLIPHLIGCGKLQPDGTRGSGLVERVDHGYQLHDNDDHATPQHVEEERRRKARERKRNWRARSQAEDGTERGTSSGTTDGTEAGQSRCDNSGDGPRARTGAPPPAARAHVIPAQPSPALPIPEDQNHVEFALDAGAREPDGAMQVFEAWRQDTGQYRARPDQKRLNRIRARMRDGFTPDQLIEAISHRHNDPHLMGQNDTGRVYDGIETLLRDTAQVERLIALVSPLRPKLVPGTSRDKRQPDRGVDPFAKAKVVTGGAS